MLYHPYSFSFHVQAKPPPVSSIRRLGNRQNTLFNVLCMTGLGLLPTLFLICLCVQLCFIEIYGSSDSVGFFVEEAALRKIYSIPATIRRWIGIDTFYLPTLSKGLLMPGP